MIAGRIIVVDTETTGVMRFDRIITLGGIKIENGIIQNNALHLIFDPRKDSHPEALAVHGYDDWMTRSQDLFSDLAPRLHNWFSWADEIVAHNAEFDMHYIQRELRKSGQPKLEQPVFCTMMQARKTWRGQSAKLDDCLARIGMQREEKRHGALEDAYLAARLYLHQKKIALPQPNVRGFFQPTNLKPHPPTPEGELPRRTPKRAKMAVTIDEV